MYQLFVLVPICSCKHFHCAAEFIPAAAMVLTLSCCFQTAEKMIKRGEAKQAAAGGAPGQVSILQQGLQMHNLCPF